MGTVVFVDQVSPERKLEKETIFKYHPDGEVCNKIMSDLIKATKMEIKDNMIVDFNFIISVKEYTPYYTPSDKSKCYQEYLSTKTEE